MMSGTQESGVEDQEGGRRMVISRIKKAEEGWRLSTLRQGASLRWPAPPASSTSRSYVTASTLGEEGREVVAVIVTLVTGTLGVDRLD